MEWKIGEIKQINGAWYQCVKSDDTCNGCVGKFQPYSFCHGFKECVGKIFKKLEKVREQFLYKGKQMQSYIRATDELICNWNNNLLLLEHGDSDIIDIEIKQTKEDMEIDKVIMNIDDRDYLLDRLEAILHDTHCQQYKDEICEAFSKYIVTETASSLKPFDLNAAKAGKPVCTRDGRKARIICFDLSEEYPIAARVYDNVGNKILLFSYKEDGRINNYDYKSDLMMLLEKKEGWVNVYDADTTFRFVEGMVYNTKDEAIQRAKEEVTNGQREKNEYVDTVKICWEE